ncbi:MAG: hypothetical protein K0R28_2839, partial [Paenibacillus sp.]|nr:hypothetical protein [Paenibacillus sp.]
MKRKSVGVVALVAMLLSVSISLVVYGQEATNADGVWQANNTAYLN